MRATILLAALVALAGGVQASLIEDTTGLHYQNDGGTGQDATDRCEDVARQGTNGTEATLEHADGAEGGQLVPVDDPADHWRLVVPEASSVSTVEVKVESSTPLGALDEEEIDQVPLVHQRVTVQTVGCEPLDTESFPAGEEATVVFEPGDETRFRLSLSIEPGVGDTAAPGLVGPVPVGQHCAPTCLFAYHMSAS